MQKVELLAPSGDYDSFVAAINAGADAIYIGGKKFGARAFSPNFNDEEMINIINEAHIKGVKVYVTANILIYENEVKEFIDYIRFLHINNVDAVIMQDIGMISLIRQMFPNLEIHASTQMNIHNVEGAKVLEQMGIKRVVLARETTIEEIKKIKEETNIELEVFISGSLCISYSGQCLMSSIIKGRSGNRGCCSQLCRMPYDVISDNEILNKNKYVLSTKDLYTVDYINELMTLGISSFKIEGRMKSSEYVYQVVSLYKKAINMKEISDEDIVNLKKLFNRDFTKGFLNNDEDITNDFRPNNMGIKIGDIIEQKKSRLKIKLNDTLNRLDGIRIIGDTDYGFTVHKIFKNTIEVEEAIEGDIIEVLCEKQLKANDIVLKTHDVLLLKEIKKININKLVDINIKLMASINNKLHIEVECDGEKFRVESDYLIEEAIKNATTKEDIIKQISKVGNSFYNVVNVEVVSDDNIFIRLIELNKIKREMIELLNNKRLYKTNFLEKEYKLDPIEIIEEKGYSYYISNIDDLKKISNYKYLYLDNLYDQIDSDKKILKLSRIMKEYNTYEGELQVGEVGGLLLNNINTLASLNVVNSYSVAFLHSLGVKRVTLSYELSENQITNIVNSYKERYNKLPNLELIISSYPELMIMKFDLYKKYNIKNDLYLKDLFGNKFKVIKKQNCNIIFSNTKKEILNVDYYLGLGINTLMKIL